MSIQAHLNGSDIELEAPQNLTDERWDYALGIARENKTAIICALEAERLCALVGARIIYEKGQRTLRFDPPLEREEVDPERWEMAEELEALFWGSL
jgi:hypothetical protein